MGKAFLTRQSYWHVSQDRTPNSSANPAVAASTIQIAATGYGPMDASGNAPVAVCFGDTPVKVLASGPVDSTPGLWRIQAQVPVGVIGQVPLYLVSGNLASNVVTIWVTQ